MAKGGKKRKVAPGDVATNRHASYRFELLDKIEMRRRAAGHRGQGAARRARLSSRTATPPIRDGELWLHNVHIPPYGPASRENHEPERPRKLLAHRREIERLIHRTRERGLTLVPTRIYFKDSRAKVEIALARGKDRFDKRESIKAREQKRDVERALRDAGR